MKKIIDYNFYAIYVRYDYCFDDIYFFNFIKNKTNRSKVILEFPTYPYDSHFPSHNFNLEKSRRKSILEEIYCITSPSLVDSIDDIDVLNFNNGYFNINNPYKSTNTALINDINIQFVMSANFAIWHGVERFFYSLDSFLKYNSKWSIKVLLIGESPYKTFLQNLAIELKLNQYVTFLGFKNHDELPLYYENSSCGIGSLSLSKENLSQSSTLKSKEYLHFGLPVIYAGNDFILDNSPYTKRVPNDDSNLDFRVILNFIEELNNIPLIRNKINSYHKEEISWNSFAQKLLKIIG